MAAAVPKTSPFRLLSLLRLEEDPNRAFHLFQNPNPGSTSNRRPFRYSARAYDVIICKLGRARMFPEMEAILDQMQRETRFTPREPLFCSIISFYGRARMPAEALRAYDRIPSFRCTRTSRSFNTLLHALLSCRDFAGVRELHRALGSNELRVTPDACTYNILLRACTSLHDARTLFDEMREKSIQPSVATFGTLISALCADLKFDDAFMVKDEMLKSFDIKPNVYIYTSLIKALCKSEKLELALELKNEMLLDQALSLDSAVYSTIIRALFRVGRKGEVVGILEEMKANGVKPDTVTYNAMIAGFCEEKEFDAVFEALNEMEKNGCKADVVSYNTIIAGFCKEKRWRDALDLFEDMPRRECRPDVVSYRTLFDGLCESGEFGEAMAILDEMMFKGFVPGAGSVRRFVKGLDCEGGTMSFRAALCGLAKQNAVESDVWEMVVGNMLKESNLMNVGKLVNHLIWGE
ncbi:Tetratricopeptide-like helical domain-containing protein [Dioscorea alata]|uniref:Tetratricopeptide-like helical domain-containing protein n=1 Tax=Dioscorea alata TaxID=55571 RepID=A0ACB7UBP1_DIOAL|nr:Tetratricopeptide-like helical domain-containing protein [Dioscorea alata]